MSSKGGEENQFNVIATTYRGYEYDASLELLNRLEEIGDSRAEVRITDLPGLLLVKANIDPLRLIDYMHKVVREEPWRVRYILRLIPVERVVETKLEVISDTASKIALSRISSRDTFKVLVEKRRTSLSRSEVIEAVASKIDRRVNLEEPDWVVLIEIIGDVTGVSVLKPRYLFSSVKEKRRLATEGRGTTI